MADRFHNGMSGVSDILAISQQLRRKGAALDRSGGQRRAAARAGRRRERELDDDPDLADLDRELAASATPEPRSRSLGQRGAAAGRLAPSDNGAAMRGVVGRARSSAMETRQAEVLKLHDESVASDDGDGDGDSQSLSAYARMRSGEKLSVELDGELDSEEQIAIESPAHRQPPPRPAAPVPGVKPLDLSRVPQNRAQSAVGAHSHRSQSSDIVIEVASARSGRSIGNGIAVNSRPNSNGSRGSASPLRKPAAAATGPVVMTIDELDDEEEITIAQPTPRAAARQSQSEPIEEVEIEVESSPRKTPRRVVAVGNGADEREERRSQMARAAEVDEEEPPARPAQRLFAEEVGEDVEEEIDADGLPSARRQATAQAQGRSAVAIEDETANENGVVDEPHYSDDFAALSVEGGLESARRGRKASPQIKPTQSNALLQQPQSILKQTLSEQKSDEPDYYSENFEELSLSPRPSARSGSPNKRTGQHSRQPSIAFAFPPSGVPSAAPLASPRSARHRHAASVSFADRPALASSAAAAREIAVQTDPLPLPFPSFGPAWAWGEGQNSVPQFPGLQPSSHAASLFGSGVGGLAMDPRYLRAAQTAFAPPTSSFALLQQLFEPKFVYAPGLSDTKFGSQSAPRVSETKATPRAPAAAPGVAEGAGAEALDDDSEFGQKIAAVMNSLQVI